jgi:RNA polymerase sigma-70 factor (ECF subfamily)
VRRTIVPFRRVEGTASEMSDEALVGACALGEIAALGALFDRYHDVVRRFLARMSGTDDRDLDDLVQITFESVPRAARGFDGRSQVKTWILGVANNVARHHVRSEIRRKRLAGEAAAATIDRADATSEILERERAALLRDAIVALPAKLREVFVLVYLEGLPGRDVADLVGAREGTIWKRLHEARALLREALQGVSP